MKYAEILKKAISDSGFSLSQLAEKMNESSSVSIHKSYLSKLQNSQIPPAGDRLNEVLAEVLGIDKVELQTAAYKEKLPKYVLERLSKGVG